VKPTSSQQIRETIAKLKQFSKGQTLGGLKVKDLIEEGRRWAVLLLTLPSPSPGVLTMRPRTQPAPCWTGSRRSAPKCPRYGIWNWPNALAIGERIGRITPARASEFIGLIDSLPIVIDERTPNVALSTVLELSRREQLSAYDASYLELAMRRGVPLATKDNPYTSMSAKSWPSTPGAPLLERHWA
jgi:predicted nucleic acid-binding protein